MSINAACELLGYSRSTFFEIRKNRESKFERELSAEEFILRKVKEIRKDLGKCGGKKLYYLICKDPEKEHYKFGRKKLFEILRNHGLLIKKRKRRAITTDSKLWRGQYPDLIRELVPSRPEEVWVSDITYFRTKEGFIYGHLITDGYSKKIVGFEVSDNMKAVTTLIALKMAIENRDYAEELIHHSDRGFQYLSRVYTDYLKRHKIRISVTQDGNPYHNAVAERLNGILKDEFGFYGIFGNLEEARELIEKSVQIYNDKRPHWSNHLLTPNEMHQQRELRIKTWGKKK